MRKDDCVLYVEDHSPNVNPPFCMKYGEDYDCENCRFTEQEKDKFLKDAEKFQEEMERQANRRRYGRKTIRNRKKVSNKMS